MKPNPQFNPVDETLDAPTMSNNVGGKKFNFKLPANFRLPQKPPEFWVRTGLIAGAALLLLTNFWQIQSLKSRVARFDKIVSQMDRFKTELQRVEVSGARRGGSDDATVRMLAERVAWLERRLGNPDAVPVTRTAAPKTTTKAAKASRDVASKKPTSKKTTKKKR